MDWYFVQDNIIEEFDTGYRVVLVVGSWTNPQEIRPIIPKGLDVLQQTRMIRLGMEFARTYSKLLNCVGA